MYQWTSTAYSAVQNDVPQSSLAEKPINVLADDQEKYLEEAVSIVRRQATAMKQALDKNRHLEALKCASTLLDQLRTSHLSPKNYYELYMAVTDELRHLDEYLLDEFTKGNRKSDLYETVQYVVNIVPRLYLLITVGLVYIKSNVSLKRSILKDLVEMCRGVQHPLRGLFLRNYLLQCTRNILPDVPVAVEECEGSILDSIEFILMNFAEMNKLWVRMQHQGHSSEKLRREKERQELKILVGTNLVRLSQLESATLETYQKLILPGILEQVVSCKDAIAQEYLMECIIQVFPDEFHLQTLDPFLKSCAQLKSGVNVKNIIISLTERLAVYTQRNKKPVNKLIADDELDGLVASGGDGCGSISDSTVGIPGSDISSEVLLFELFSVQIANIVQIRADIMPIEDVISLQVALASLALKVYPDRVDYVDKVLESTLQIVDRTMNSSFLSPALSIAYTTPVCRELSRLLRLCIETYNNVLTILKLRYFTALLDKFDYRARKAIAIAIVMKVQEKETLIPDVEQVEQILRIIASLITNEETDSGQESPVDPDDFIEEQGLVARFLYHLRSEEPDMQFKILQLARKTLEQGGEQRIKYVLPPLVFQAFQLAVKYKSLENEDSLWDKKCQKILEYCRKTIKALAKKELPELAMRLYLQAALCISRLGYTNDEAIAYDFMTQAYTLFEEEISDSKAKLSAVTLIIATLEQMTCFSEENAESLRSNFANAASKLLKKPDQCRVMVASASLFWSGKQNGKELRDEKKTLFYLNKAERTVPNCKDLNVQVQLYVELFNHYLYYFERGNSLITVKILNELIAKINQELPKLEESEETAQIKMHYSNTMVHIQSRMESTNDLNNGSLAISFAGIALN